ncbi:MAG: hypothetical protein COA41_11255 [Sphingopyxis sp.]|nr:MAG: hypothetical protein COA41_11255 [Sphingopyxis sp.]
MTETYGHRWTGNFGDQPDPDHAWAKHLSGLTGRQIARGIQNMTTGNQHNEWPPSALAFRALCVQIPGLPTAIAAWLQALEGRYEHEAVKVAAALTGEFDLRSARMNDRPLQKVFERNYEIVCRRLQNDEPLDGSVATGLGHESQKSEAQRAQEYAEQQLHKRIEQQGIPPGANARAVLLAKLGINRGESRA